MKTFVILHRYHIHPRKRLGQNFLIDNNICNKMIQALSLNKDDTVVEIGAGLGILTEHIASQCAHVWAIETDKKLCDILREEIASQYSNIEVVPESILHVNIAKMTGRKKVKVIGNLPYYITTKILFHLVQYRRYISTAILTVQKEVAERLLAMPGRKPYGRLTVSMRFFAEIEKLFQIQPTSFFPSPGVTSSVLKMTFRQQKLKDVDESLILNIIEALFQERRKNVHNGLCLLKSPRINKTDSKNILTACAIRLTTRAEELMLKDFIALTRCISNY